QGPPGSSARRRLYPAAMPDVTENAQRRRIKHPTNRLQAFAALPALTQFRALSGGHTPISSLHWLRSTTSIQGTCCDDQLNSLRKAKSHKKEYGSTSICTRTFDGSFTRLIQAA